MFFQVALLAGYAWAHLGMSLTGLADASRWVIVARSYADLARLAEGVEWATGRVDGRRPWTDRHSDLLSALE